VTEAAKVERFYTREGTLTARRRHFETIFILNPGMDEKLVQEMIEKNAQLVGNTEGTLLRQDDWGKLRLAYPLDKHAQGRYFYFRYVGAATTVAALERSFRLDANCLRYQTVRLSGDLSQQEIDDLMQRAPREPQMSPTAQSDDNYEFMH